MTAKFFANCKKSVFFVCRELSSFACVELESERVQRSRKARAGRSEHTSTELFEDVAERKPGQA